MIVNHQMKERINTFLNYKNLGHNTLCGITPPSHTKAELNSLIFILLEEASREKEDFFFPFSILVDPEHNSVLTLWSKIFSD